LSWKLFGVSEVLTVAIIRGIALMIWGIKYLFNVGQFLQNYAGQHSIRQSCSPFILWIINLILQIRRIKALPYAKDKASRCVINYVRFYRYFNLLFAWQMVLHWTEYFPTVICR
jgi:hypothetical protein